MAGPEQHEIFKLLGVARGSAAGWAIVIFGALHLAGLYGCVMLGLVRHGTNARAWPMAVAVVTVTLYLLAIGGPEMYPRFRMPLMPMLAALAGLAFMDERVVS